MTEFKGTKGKWIIEGEPRFNMEDNDNDGTFQIKTKNDTTVSECAAYKFFGIKSIEEANYNAKLISKAPEMLNMLDRILFTVFWNGSNLNLKDKKDIEQLIKEATEL